MESAFSSNDSQSPPGTGGNRAVPVSIAEHELIKQIGRGSYGQVWLARNAMGAYRAIKIVHRDSFRDRKPFERELSGIRIFEPISRSHEGFVDVLQVGMNPDQTCFYYVMELGDDHVLGANISPAIYSPKTLSKEIARKGKLSWQGCLELGLALSQALAELHKHKLVHRDVKPSNIIFVNGVPKLADIGLVAEVDAARSYVGTEGYIPPEGPGTPQADVYSLGKVLYEASSGKDRQDFPELPTQWDKSPDHTLWRELNEVILQACSADPAKRHRTAWDLYSHLLLLANGQSVRRVRALEQTVARLKRSARVLALALPILAVIGYAVYRERRSALEVHQRRLGSSIAYGNSAMNSGDLLGAIPHYVEAFRLDADDPARAAHHRLRLGALLAQCPKLVLVASVARQADTVVFSPEGRRLLIVEHRGRARLLDAQTGQNITPPFGQANRLREGAFSPDGQWVATASFDGIACIWNSSDVSLAATFPHSRAIYTAHWSPDGSKLITTCDDNRAWIWNIKTKQVERWLEGHTGSVIFGDFSADGKRIATGSRDGTARIWDAASGQLLQTLKHGGWVDYAAFSADGQKLLTADAGNNKACVWEVATGKKIPPDMPHSDGVRSAKFSPDGRLILTGALDGTARLWLEEDHQPLNPNPILWQSSRTMDASFSPDGERVVAGGADGSLRIWDLAGSTVARSPLPCIASPTFTRYLTFTNSEIQVWDTLSSRAVAQPIHLAAPVLEASFSQNGEYVLSSSRPGSAPVIEVWRAPTSVRAGPPLPLTNALKELALSDDGQCLLAVDRTNAQTWDVSAGRILASAIAHAAGAQGVFGPSNQLVATWKGDEVLVWDRSTGTNLFPPLKHDFGVEHVEFSADGKQLLTCCNETFFSACYAQIWSLATGKPVGPRLGHRDGVKWATFSPDGQQVATSGEDFRAMVWERSTGKPRTAALLHGGQVQGVNFSADATRLVTASGDRTARVWNTATGDPLTPPLRHLFSLSRAGFVGENQAVVTIGNQRIWVWELPQASQPLEDLLKLARLLSGEAYAASASGDSQSSRPGPMRALWDELRAQQPAWFTTSETERAAWHRFQADQSEMTEAWKAAAFHLERLVQLRPEDQSSIERLKQLKKKFSDAL